MPTIFISYRRGDSANVTGRLYDRLVERYGRASVFKDVDSIPPGARFADYIAESIQASDVALVMIGPRWLTASAGFGRRRLDAPNDFVRLEAETALKLGVPVIPVLVDGASLPPAKRLPASLRPLLEQNAVVLRPDPDFSHDFERLTHAIDYWQGQPRRPDVAAAPTSIDRPHATSDDANDAPELRRSRIATAVRTASGTTPARPPSSRRVAGWAAATLTLAVVIALVAVLKLPHMPGATSLTPAEATATSNAVATGQAQMYATWYARTGAATPISLVYTSAHPGCDAHWIPAPPPARVITCSSSGARITGNGHATNVSASATKVGLSYIVQVTISDLSGAGMVELTGDGADESLIFWNTSAGNLAVALRQLNGSGVGTGPEEIPLSSTSIAHASTYVVTMQVRATGSPINPNNLSVSINQVTVLPFGYIHQPTGGDLFVTPGALNGVELALYSNTSESPPTSADSVTYSDFRLTPMT